MKAPKDRKVHMLHIRVTLTELGRLERQAAKLGMGISAFVRWVALYAK